MAKKKKEKEDKPKGLAAFRESQKKALKRDPEIQLIEKTPGDIYSSGSIIIDKIAGTSGFVKGSIVEISGAEHSGKTTLCMQTAKNVQRQGGTVAYFNTEQTLDPKYAASLGLDVSEDKFFYTTENTYSALEPMLSDVIDQAQVNLLIIDSVTSIYEDENKMIGVAARFWSNFTPKLIRLAAENNTLILMTNQIRVTEINHLGAKKDTTGGAALKYYKNLSVHLKGRKESSQQIEDEFGNKTYGVANNHTTVTATIEKNKWGEPYKSAVGRIIPSLGFDNVYSLFQLAVKQGLVKQAGAWISYGEGTEHAFKVQGIDNAVTYIRTSPDLLQVLVKEVGLADAENYFSDVLL